MNHRAPGSKVQAIDEKQYTVYDCIQYSVERYFVARGDYVVISPPPNRALGVDHRGPAVEVLQRNIMLE